MRRDRQSLADSWAEQELNRFSYVSGSFRLAEHPGDFVSEWWRALKDPPTKAGWRPVGGSFRARHHNIRNQKRLNLSEPETHVDFFWSADDAGARRRSFLFASASICGQVLGWWADPASSIQHLPPSPWQSSGRNPYSSLENNVRVKGGNHALDLRVSTLSGHAQPRRGGGADR